MAATSKLALVISCAMVGARAVKLSSYAGEDPSQLPTSSASSFGAVDEEEELREADAAPCDCQDRITAYSKHNFPCMMSDHLFVIDRPPDTPAHKAVRRAKHCMDFFSLFGKTVCKKIPSYLKSEDTARYCPPSPGCSAKNNITHLGFSQNVSMWQFCTEGEDTMWRDMHPYTLVHESQIKDFDLNDMMRLLYLTYQGKTKDEVEAFWADPQGASENVTRMDPELRESLEQVRASQRPVIFDSEAKKGFAVVFGSMWVEVSDNMVFSSGQGHEMDTIHPGTYTAAKCKYDCRFAHMPE